MAVTTAVSDHEYKSVVEDIWVILRENAERMKETDRQMQEADRRRKEADRETQEIKELFRKTDREMQETKQLFKETDRQMQETDRRMQETDRRMKELGIQMGDLNNRFGELAEHLVAPGIAERFNELGYHFDAMAPGGHRIFDEHGKIKAEVDILLENGDIIIAVEVKVKPAVKDVQENIKRLEILRESRRKKNDTRKIRGAIAGAIFGVAQKRATAQAGLYVIEQSGDTMRIHIPDGFVPREW